MKRNQGIAAITGKNVIGFKSHNVIKRKLTLWVKNYIISEPITRIDSSSLWVDLSGAFVSRIFCRKSALKALKSDIHVAGGRHEN